MQYRKKTGNPEYSPQDPPRIEATDDNVSPVSYADLPFRQQPVEKRLQDALLRGDRNAAAALLESCGPSILADSKNAVLHDLTNRYLSGTLPFCQLTAAAQAACVFFDSTLPPVACCGAAYGNTSAAGRDYTMMLLTMWGIPALDLGVDVSPEAFLSAITENSLQYAVCGIFTAAEADCVRQLHTLAEARGIRGSFRLVVCGGSSLEDEMLRDLPADFLTHRSAEAAQWIMNTWKR